MLQDSSRGPRPKTEGTTSGEIHGCLKPCVGVRFQSPQMDEPRREAGCQRVIQNRLKKLFDFFSAWTFGCLRLSLRWRVVWLQRKQDPGARAWNCLLSMLLVPSSLDRPDLPLLARGGLIAFPLFFQHRVPPLSLPFNVFLAFLSRFESAVPGRLGRRGGKPPKEVAAEF